MVLTSSKLRVQGESNPLPSQATTCVVHSVYPYDSRAPFLELAILRSHKDFIKKWVTDLTATLGHFLRAEYNLKWIFFCKPHP